MCRALSIALSDPASASLGKYVIRTTTSSSPSKEGEKRSSSFPSATPTATTPSEVLTDVYTNNIVLATDAPSSRRLLSTLKQASPELSLDLSSLDHIQNRR